MSEWMMKGEYVKNCNCAPGCPCDFWADPTHNICEGMCGMKITEGHFDGTKLDGLIWVCSYYWPGPLYQGNGTLQPYVCANASEDQRMAILTILSGQAGNAWYEMLASILTTVHDPIFTTIDWKFDLAKRTAHIAIEGEMETSTSPIINIATGEEHRVLVDMPNGMEYFTPEIAQAKTLKSTGKVAYDCPNAHSSLTVVNQTHAGLVA